MNKKKKSYIVSVVTAFLAIAGLMAVEFMKPGEEPAYIPYGEFLNMAESGGVAEVSLSNGARIGFTGPGGTAYETDNPRKAELKEDLLLLGVSVTEESSAAAEPLLSTVVSLVCFGAAILFAARLMHRQSGGAVMAMDVKDAAPERKERVGFDDVAGNEEAKDSVSDIVDFIKNPEKSTRYGARMPRGVIFYGPPGTGKTLMAKAIAGEAGAAFYAVSGSDFVQMYVGIGASRVRALFKKAREAGGAVIFIDEIDALAKKRAASPSGGSDERDQTLNALLTEMSGFEPNDGVVVIAATNRLDTLDEALLRPGRFDRSVEIGLPDLNGRERILRLHCKNKPMSDSVDIGRLARQTVYFSGAMLENLLNEAAITAARKGAESISHQDVDEAYYSIIAGKAKKDRSGIMERERRTTAWHEAGHALAAKLMCPENTVAKITIIPSTKGAGGFCLNIPPDKLYFTKNELEAQVVVSLAGRAAEEINSGAENVTTGAANDLAQASALARDIVSKYGMSEAGLAPIAEADINREHAGILERLYNEARGLLRANEAALKRVANALLLKETLNEAELEGMIREENR
ncbi:MAG: AAA family ATPase [Clostridiales bacterium]|jgi:cell division protease FtsH|nr:AAA family ATPase [Clostridiales bacterium]